MWLTDPVSKRKSVTLTSFIVGYSIAILKLIFGGLTIFGLAIPVFTGFEFAAAVGALGGIYVMRRTKGGQQFGPAICAPTEGQTNG